LKHSRGGNALKTPPPSVPSGLPDTIGAQRRLIDTRACATGKLPFVPASQFNSDV